MASGAPAARQATRQKYAAPKIAGMEPLKRGCNREYFMGGESTMRLTALSAAGPRLLHTRGKRRLRPSTFWGTGSGFLRVVLHPKIGVASLEAGLVMHARGIVTELIG